MVAQQAARLHGTADHQALIAASSNCVVKGEAWMAHCQQMLVAGDKSMLPDCPRLGIEMVTLCGALRTLAGQDAPSLPKLAAVNDGRLLALRSSLPQIRQDHGLL